MAAKELDRNAESVNLAMMMDMVLSVFDRILFLS